MRKKRGQRCSHEPLAEVSKFSFFCILLLVFFFFFSLQRDLNSNYKTKKILNVA